MKKSVFLFLAVPAVFGAFFLLTGLAPGEEKKDGAVYHTVEKGDTLWDISEKYLKDPVRWPDLWKRNPAIKNPHLIYPGDIVRISPDGIEVIPAGMAVSQPSSTAYQPSSTVEKLRPEPKEEEPAGLPVVKLKEEPAPQPQPSSTANQPASLVKKIALRHMAKDGFILKKELEKTGVILRAKDEQKMFLNNGDMVFLSFKAPEAIKANDRFTIIREGEMIYHPVTKRYLGHEFESLGTLRVTGLAGPPAGLDGVTEGIIEASIKEIQKGARLIAYAEPMTEVVVVRAEKEVKGYVIAGMEGKKELMESDILYIDRGSEDGIKEGNVLDVYRERGRIRDPFKRGKKLNLPPNVVGRVLVINTRGRSSTAVVLAGIDGIRPGDRVMTAPANQPSSTGDQPALPDEQPGSPAAE
ncbi:MAG: LysM peptidoglycan-binding domain-containing protein [Deltaproteobacteria bacterium]|nr:LysM peptidoglycan-binding domain-containing protein [Deltaproteobacteria bacterium]